MATLKICLRRRGREKAKLCSRRLGRFGGVKNDVAEWEKDLKAKRETNTRAEG